MILTAYTLHDVKAVSYSPPFFTASDGLATRMVMELAQDGSTTVGRHPADFTLFAVGTFDFDTGRLLPAEDRRHIADVVSLLPARPRDFFTATVTPTSNGVAPDSIALKGTVTES